MPSTSARTAAPKFSPRPIRPGRSSGRPTACDRGYWKMPRINRGTTTRARHKRILEQAKGYYGRRKNTIRIARQAVEKAGQYAYRDRKVKKRTFRGLWIQRINAAVRAEGL